MTVSEESKRNVIFYNEMGDVDFGMKLEAIRKVDRLVITLESLVFEFRGFGLV
ncbi:MAG: hypothetical protein FWG67_07270 [Defluviitaleaceae bacterium]|nr:hypothetical protein [Defluviitaleaceae bacterium]